MPKITVYRYDDQDYEDCQIIPARGDSFKTLTADQKKVELAIRATLSLHCSNRERDAAEVKRPNSPHRGQVIERPTGVISNCQVFVNVLVENQKVAKDGHQHGCPDQVGLAEFAKLAPTRASFKPSEYFSNFHPRASAVDRSMRTAIACSRAGSADIARPTLAMCNAE